MGSVCVNGRCGFREKSERRDCPKCGWLMLDGPLPATGSMTPPPRHFTFRTFAPAIAGGVVIFFGAIGMTAASWGSADPVASHAAPAPASEVANVEPAPVEPIATLAPAVDAAAPEPAKVLAASAKPAVKKAAAKPVAKKSVAKKSATKKPAAKKSTKKTVARR